MGNEQKTQDKGGSVGVVDAILAKAFASGRRSGLDGLPLSSNEYPAGSLEHYQWQLGWRSGNGARVYAEALACPA